MLVTTTSSLEGFRIVRYLGIVGGEERVLNWGSAKKSLRAATHRAFAEMRQLATSVGANAIVGVQVDHEVIGGSSILVMAYGTAVFCVDATTNAPLITDTPVPQDAPLPPVPPPPPPAGMLP